MVFGTLRGSLSRASKKSAGRADPGNAAGVLILLPIRKKRAHGVNQVVCNSNRPSTFLELWPIQIRKSLPEQENHL